MISVRVLLKRNMMAAVVLLTAMVVALPRCVLWIAHNAMVCASTYQRKGHGGRFNCVRVQHTGTRAVNC